MLLAKKWLPNRFRNNLNPKFLLISQNLWGIFSDWFQFIALNINLNFPCQQLPNHNLHRMRCIKTSHATEQTKKIRKLRYLHSVSLTPLIYVSLAASSSKSYRERKLVDKYIEYSAARLTYLFLRERLNFGFYYLKFDYQLFFSVLQ